MDTVKSSKSSVLCKSSEGIELHSALLRLSRRRAVLEIYDPHIVLKMSEVLDLKISARQRQIYSGRAVISNLVNTGTTMICETKLDEVWVGEDQATPGINADLQKGFSEFVQTWQKVYRIVPEYKILIADIQSFLTDLRLWLEHVELEIGETGPIHRLQVERQVIRDLAPPVIQTINSFFDKFEALANNCLLYTSDAADE